MAMSKTVKSLPTDTASDMPMKMLWNKMPISRRKTCIIAFL